MSDDEVDSDVTATGGDASTDRPNPAANAARRARRIGGRPTPAPRPEPEVEPSIEPAAQRVRPDKPASSRPAQPDRAAVVRSLPLAWFPAAVLGTAAILLLGLLIWFGHGGYWDKPAQHSVSTPGVTEQEQVLAAAKKCFATLNSYDYRKLDDALAAGLKCTTGGFTNDYKLAFQNTIDKLAPTRKAVQTAQVNKAGIESIGSTGKQWVILIYGQLQITNVSTEKSGSPQISPVGGVLTMNDVGGKWLVSKVDVDSGTGLGG